MMAGDVASTVLSRMASSPLSLERTPACGCVAAATALAGKHDHSCGLNPLMEEGVVMTVERE